MRARIVSPADLSETEMGVWRELQAKDRALQSPFLAPEFARAIAKARSDARVAILEANGRICGFLPFHRNSAGVGKPIAGPIADYQGPILDPDVELDGPTLLRICGLKAYDFNHGPAATGMLRRGAVHFTQSPCIDLTDGYAAYLANRPKAGRHAVKETERRQRKIEREVGRLRFEMHDVQPGAHDWLIATKAAAYRRLGVASAFDVPWIDRALRAVMAEQGPAFAGVLSTVYAGDRLIAANLGMRSPTTLCWWFNTYDEDLRNYAPGLILLLLAAERAAAEGLAKIDFGRGDEHYKLTFANDATPLCEGSIERLGTAAGVLRRAQKAALRGLARAPLGRFESWPRRAMARLVTGMHLQQEPG